MRKNTSKNAVAKKSIPGTQALSVGLFGAVIKLQHRWKICIYVRLYQRHR